MYNFSLNFAFVLPLWLIAAVAGRDGVWAGDAVNTGNGGNPGSAAKALTFVNSSVSVRSIGLNEPVRVEFTTLPRQLPEVDVAVQVRNAITLGAGQTWRLMGTPLVTEHEKSKTVNVAFAVLPRSTGPAELPMIPLTWLKSGGVAGFGVVEVKENVAIGPEKAPVPSEVFGVAKVPWGAVYDEWKERIPGATPGTNGQIRWLRTDRGLELRFIGGELGEAVMPATGLSLDVARASFVSRWGTPHSETPSSLTWYLGWTRITASTDPQGVSLHILREDHAARQDTRKVEATVFDALEGRGNAPTPAGLDMSIEVQRLMRSSATATTIPSK